MESHVVLSRLLDLYGAFLTERQRTLLTQSVNEDFSLSEIAELEGISRQGVRDALKRAQTQLEDMESKLGLLKITDRLQALKAELEAQGASEALVCMADELLDLSGG